MKISFNTDHCGLAVGRIRLNIRGFSDLMGLDHTRLTYNYSGRDFRLTDVAGVVAQKIIA
jgi:hypothetical protein